MPKYRRSDNKMPAFRKKRREFGGRSVVHLMRMAVVATRKCRINCNEILSPPYRLSNGRQSGAAGEVIDAWHRIFSFLR